MHKIVIRNFGPITNCELEIADYLTFIGPQASGKSTLSKCIFFFKSLREDFIKYMYECVEERNKEIHIKNFAKIVRSKFLQYWGSTNHLSDIYLKYAYSDGSYVEITIKRDRNKGYVDPFFSKDFMNTFHNISTYLVKYLDELEHSALSFPSVPEMIQIELNKRTFLNTLQRFANDLFQEHRDLLFIPAGRSLLAILTDQLQLISYHSLDYLMQSFLERINANKKVFRQSLDDIIADKKNLTSDAIDEKNSRFAATIIKKILKGEYRNDKDGEKIYIDNKKFIRLNYSSSGQQEVIWILYLIFLLVLEKRSVSIVIEEPEAHLYPEAQKHIVDLIFLLANQNNNQVIITTHSPYILSSMNNLLYAQQIAYENEQNVERVVPRQFWIDIHKFEAYFISKGRMTPIIDEDLKLIKVEMIDSASGIINKQYDQLLEVETSNMENRP